jgi:hypothetical protein
VKAEDENEGGWAVKRILFCLLLGTSASAGCLTFPKGVRPWPHDSSSNENSEKPGKAEKAEKAEPAEPPPTPKIVKPDDVSEQNYREKLRQLDAEIRREEQDK